MGRKIRLKNELQQGRDELEQQKIQLKEEQRSLGRAGVRTHWVFQEGDAWKPYSAEHNDQLTAARNAGQAQLSLQRGTFTYDVDLVVMQQVNRRTGTQRRIQTRLANMETIMPHAPILICQKFEASVLPSSRLALTSESLVKGSLEEFLYCRAEAQFHRMSTQQARTGVARVELVLNKAVAQRYEDAKANLAAQRQPVAEEYGFHGTLPEHINKITQEGFKVGGVDVPARNGSAYGQGVYLAKHPELSLGHRFSSGARCLLLVRFLTTQAHAHREAWVVRRPEHVYPEFVLHLA